MEVDTMTQLIRDVMTPGPTAVPATATAAEAARAMRDEDIGDVIVLEEGRVCGILTDRDLVIRGVAQGKDVNTTSVGSLCSRELTVLAPSDSVENAVELMRRKAVRRLPVVENGQPVGIVSLGDLARERDPQSALGQISDSPPNR
jgi:CBS domain-containing protein